MTQLYPHSLARPVKRLMWMMGILMVLGIVMLGYAGLNLFGTEKAGTSNQATTDVASSGGDNPSIACVNQGVVELPPGRIIESFGHVDDRSVITLQQMDGSYVMITLNRCTGAIEQQFILQHRSAGQ